MNAASVGKTSTTTNQTMSDITTVEEVSAGDYQVRVAQTDDGAAWEAVVIGESGGGASMGMAGMMLGMPTPDSDDGGDPLGPPVTAPHRWVAIGFAIEAYEWGEIGEETVSVPEGYQHLTVDGTPIGELEDLSIGFDGDTERMFDHGKTFTGSFNLIPDDETDGEDDDG